MDPIIYLGRCLADPTAVRLLVVLFESPKTMLQLQREFSIPRPALELRLKKLKEAELVLITGPARNALVKLADSKRTIVESILVDASDHLAWDEELTQIRKRQELLIA